MSTKKFVATSSSYSFEGRMLLIDERGNRYRPAWMGQYPAQIGDKLYLGKRLNNHHGELPKWELWEYVVEASDSNWPQSSSPKRWFPDGRKLFEKL